MNTLLIINDNTPEAKHAAELALAMAQKMSANIILANNFVKIEKQTEKVPANVMYKRVVDERSNFSLRTYLTSLNAEKSDFKPVIDELDISYMSESQLADVINKNQITMMVKGMADVTKLSSTRNLNIHEVLNKVLCPLLLIPISWQLKDIERMVYIADLRYCRLHLVQFLATMAKPWGADLLVAHMSANGLPDMAEKYANTVFNEEISNNVKYDRLFFNNIKEKDLGKAVDVLINGMHNDILVLVNHRYHFEEIVGRYITDTMPLNINTPVLVFPY